MSSGTMTLLQAVNKILKAIGEPRVAATDTGGTSLAGKAEEELNDVNQEVQNRGWHAGTTDDYEMKLATQSIAASGGSGDFLYDETVTETTSGATGQFKTLGPSMLLVPLTGTFTGGETLTGAVSGATRTGAALTVLTEGKHYLNPAWVKVASSESEPLRLARRADLLYDETNQTGTFSASVLLDVTRELYFADLPYALANYVACRTAFDMQQRYERESLNSRRLQKEMDDAFAQAVVEDEDMRQSNIFDTPGARKIRGHRVYNEASHRIIS